MNTYWYVNTSTLPVGGTRSAYLRFKNLAELRLTRELTTLSTFNCIISFHGPTICALMSWKIMHPPLPSMFPIWLAGLNVLVIMNAQFGPFINLDGDRLQAAPSPLHYPKLRTVLAPDLPW